MNTFESKTGKYIFHIDIFSSAQSSIPCYVFDFNGKAQIVDSIRANNVKEIAEFFNKYNKI